MPLEDWIQHSRVNQFLHDWQTVIASVLALAAGVITVAVTMIIARRQITASREEADRVIAATRDQTETTVRLERERVLSEHKAFRDMLEAAMARVLAEAAWAKETYPQYVGQAQGASIDAKDASRDALTVRECFTKGAFAELRAACVRRGGPLTGEFLALEREIDSFAMQREDKIITSGFLVQWGKHAGLREQFARIEKKAAALRDKAAERIS